MLPRISEVKGGASLLQGFTFSHLNMFTIKNLSKVPMKTLEETVKEQGGEEFLAMVKEVRKKKENG